MEQNLKTVHIISERETLGQQVIRDMGRLAAAMPRIFRVVITTQSRGVRRSLQCGDPLTTIGRWMGVGGVSPGQKLADPVSLSSSLSRSFP